MLWLQRVGIQADRIEVQERVMLLGVEVCIAHETGGRHALFVGFPGASAGFDQVGQVGLV